MITLGLDPSLRGFGWCLHRSTVVGRARVISKGVWHAPSTRSFIWRYMFMRKMVGDLVDGHPEIEGVGLESPIFGETWSEGAYGLFLYTIEALFVRLKDVVLFGPHTVKLLAKMDPKVRRGTMDKRDMIEAARADTQVREWDHNEADAYLIARSAARFWDLYRGHISEEELTPSEKHSFTRVHTYRTGRKVSRGIIFREGDRFFPFSALSPQDIESIKCLQQQQ